MRLQSSNRYKEALQTLEVFHDISVDGLYYYQRYHRFSLYAATTFSYVGFVLYVAIILTKNYSPLTVPVEMTAGKSRRIYLISFITMCLTTAATYAQNAPWHYAVYYTCPVIVAQVNADALKQYFSFKVLDQGFPTFLCLRPPKHQLRPPTDTNVPKISLI